MQQSFKRFLWIIGLAVSLQSAWAFSLAGPIANGGDSWQQGVIGYGLPGDLNAPKNIGEDYRRNTPVLYYVYDETFSDYFGANGEAAVDGAFAIMNSLTNVDSYSIPLTEFSTEARHLNYQAQALGLRDLKSWSLGAIIEQMGLADPVRYDWTLHDRWRPAGNPPPCPGGMEYLVVPRNYNSIASPLNQLQYSPYVNDVLYSYQILEFCSGPNPLAVANPFSVDPLAAIYSPVASFQSTGLGYGEFYTGLTRDDVAGLRYLLTTNNVHREAIVPDSLMQFTNTSLPTPFYTSNLTALVMAARTNDPVTLAGMFPGLVVGGSTTYYTLGSNPIVSVTFKVNAGDPIGTLPHAVVKTNGWTFFFVNNYVTTFANVVITTNFFANSYRSNTPARLVTTTVGIPSGSPIGTLPQTNTTSKNIILTNVPSGDYFLIPPGTCGPEFVAYGFDTVTAATNILVSGFNSSGSFYEQSIVTYFTNHAYIVNPCTLQAGATDRYQGIKRIRFVRVPDTNFDSYSGNFYNPMTNTYTMVVKTNGQYLTRTFQRVVTGPDIRFAATDLASGPSSSIQPVVYSFGRNLNFDQANILAGLAGPGTINPSTTITFNKVGPVYWNIAGDTLDGTPYFTETPGNSTTSFYGAYFVWSTYDGSTNDPIVYPNGSSLANLQSQVLIKVSPATLPDGANGVLYDGTDAILTATGGQPPYTWSLAPDSQPLPQGLDLYANGVIFGTPLGNAPGEYDFTVQLIDSGVPTPRTLQLNYSINIQ